MVLSTALLALSGTVLAAPPSARQPALRPLDDQGILDSVADRGSQIISSVRDGATGLVDSAMNFLGVRYKLGGNSAENGFDCSGFTRYVFENSIGRILPHTAGEQANAPGLTKVDQKDLKPGDLVFFNTMRRTFSHVGIYLGDGKFIHSPRTGESVRIEDINISYWARHFTGARRVPELANATASNGSAAGSPGAGAALLASLQARFAGQPAGTEASSVVTPVTTSVVTPVVSTSLNPSGLKLGSSLPSLSNASVPGFMPSHDPLSRPMMDR